VAAFRAMGPDLEATRRLAGRATTSLRPNSALRERELSKGAALSSIVAASLRQRGLADWRATLLAQVATTVLGHAIHTWLADPDGNIDVSSSEPSPTSVISRTSRQSDV
jgi:hypothetical protein